MEINILQGGQIVQGKTFLDDGLESGDAASPSFPQKKSYILNLHKDMLQ